MNGGGCRDDSDIIDARLQTGCLPALSFEQPAKQQLLNANVLPIQTLDYGNCCIEAINRTVYNDENYERVCKTR